MIETDVIEGFDDHYCRVPADCPSYPTLHLFIAWKPGFLSGRDGVDVRRRDHSRYIDSHFARSLNESSDQVGAAGYAGVPNRSV